MPGPCASRPYMAAWHSLVLPAFPNCHGNACMHLGVLELQERTWGCIDFEAQQTINPSCQA